MLLTQMRRPSCGHMHLCSVHAFLHTFDQCKGEYNSFEIHLQMGVGQTLVMNEIRSRLTQFQLLLGILLIVQPHNENWENWIEKNQPKKIHSLQLFIYLFVSFGSLCQVPTMHV